MILVHCAALGIFYSFELVVPRGPQKHAGWPKNMPLINDQKIV